jgi:uncharacterized protein YbaP (TraB family)
MRLALLVMAVFAVGCHSKICPTSRPATAGPPFAWRITGPSGSLVIQATHQGVDDGAISEAAWRALQDADVYITEADEAVGHAPASPDAAMPLFQLPPDQPLDLFITADDFGALQRELDIEPRQLLRMKPWVAFMLLGQARVEFAGKSMNAVLLERARSRHLQTVFLETWNDQVRYLDAAITPRKLTLAIRDRQQACRLERRFAAFRAGDDSAFINDIVEGEPVVARIDRWYPAIQALATAGGRPFVAVGIGQLLGPYGLLGRFVADGYRVQRL